MQQADADCFDLMSRCMVDLMSMWCMVDLMSRCTIKQVQQVEWVWMHCLVLPDDSPPHQWLCSQTSTESVHRNLDSAGCGNQPSYCSASDRSPATQEPTSVCASLDIGLALLAASISCVLVSCVYAMLCILGYTIPYLQQGRSAE